MRIVIANCSAVYTGRGDTQLLPGVRAIFIKEDGAVSIHNDAGNKPLNYMGKDNVFSESIDDEDTLVWSFDTRKENLTLKLHSVISDTAHQLIINDAGLVRDGTEDQLQEWLSLNTHIFGEGCTLVKREYATGHGPVDLLIRSAEGDYIAVEVKRIAMLTSVDQVRRYAAALNESGDLGHVRAMIAAIDIRPKTQALADKRGVELFLIPSNWKELK